MADAEQCAALLLETVPRVMRDLRRDVEGGAQDMTMAQFRALRFISKQDGASVSAVAERLGLSVPAASKLVTELVDRGLVVRETSSEDRRLALLRLSPEARARWKKRQDAARRSLAKRLASLDAADLARLSAGLEVLHRALEAEEARP